MTSQDFSLHTIVTEQMVYASFLSTHSPVSVYFLTGSTAKILGLVYD
jgi:hypothetical protein